MEAPLWIDRHRPTLDELPQSELRRYLERVAHGPTNLLLYGPPGSGKTAAVHALATTLHERPDQDLMTINVSDFFGMTKRELVDDPRFASFIEPGRRQDSKASLVNHVLQEMAGYPPVSGHYKTVLLDNAEAMREDFQQALRRVMERHYEATQFILTTRRLGAVIDPIRSRCVQLPVRAPTTEETVNILRTIAEAEDVAYDADGLAFVAEYAEGNLRRAILGAQLTAAEAGTITDEAAYHALDDIGPGAQVLEMLKDAETGAFTDAQKTLDDLLITEGFSGEEVLVDLLQAAASRYEPDRLAWLSELAGEIEFDMHRGTSDRVHLSHLLTRIGPIQD